MAYQAQCEPSAIKQSLTITSFNSFSQKKNWNRTRDYPVLLEREPLCELQQRIKMLLTPLTFFINFGSNKSKIKASSLYLFKNTSLRCRLGKLLKDHCCSAFGRQVHFELQHYCTALISSFTEICFETISCWVNRAEPAPASASDLLKSLFCAGQTIFCVQEFLCPAFLDYGFPTTIVRLRPIQLQLYTYKFTTTIQIQRNNYDCTTTTV